MTLLNVNITDITDESEYIESIGKKASATAVNQAKVDVAEQEKQGEIGKSLAERDRRVSVASYNAEAVKGENDSKAHIALTNATLAEKEAEASQRSQVAKQNAEAEIQKARAFAQTQLLEAEQIVPQEIRKRKIQIDAEAEALSKVLVAKGEAEAILAIRKLKLKASKNFSTPKPKVTSSSCKLAETMLRARQPCSSSKNSKRSSKFKPKRSRTSRSTRSLSGTAERMKTAKDLPLRTSSASL